MEGKRMKALLANAMHQTIHHTKPQTEHYTKPQTEHYTKPQTEHHTKPQTAHHTKLQTAHHTNKTMLIAFAAMSFLWIIPLKASACTAVYVGKGASDDGTVIIARSNDSQGVMGNYVKIMEAKNKGGRKMPVDVEQTVLEELPEETYRCIATPWFDSTAAANGPAIDAAVCTNEKGVAMTMSVTAFSNKKALKADPLVKKGLTENTANDLVVCQAESAREATETLLGLIDTYGSSESNIALITDQEETWYIEMYTGHQYAAVKLPQDKVSVFGSEFQLEYISDYEDAILSPELESLAEDKDFAVYGENHELNLLSTYSGPKTVKDYCHMRTWIGHQVLAPSTFKYDYDKKVNYPLCFVPAHKVSVQDVMELLRNRYEGTTYSSDETKRKDILPIGTVTALSVHVVQVYPDLPSDMCTLLWESTGPSVYGVFVPISNVALSVSEPYGRNQSTTEQGKFDTEQYPYYRFKELTTLCDGKKNREIYGDPVRAYWHEAETAMIKGTKEVLEKAAGLDHDSAASYITEYCNGLQDQAFADSGEILDDLRWYKSENSCSIKYDYDYETFELDDKLKVVDPLEIRLDPSSYEKIPETP